MITLITLTTAGPSTGPFNLYSNNDAYTTAFESGVTKAALVAGYTSTLVPDGTVTIRVRSTGTCNTQVDLPISGIPPGPTTTSTSSTTSTSTTTAPPTGNITVSYNTYSTAFTIYSDVAVPQSVFVSGAVSVTGYLYNSCGSGESIASATLTGGTLGLTVGNTIATHAPTSIAGSWGMGSPYKFDTLSIPLAINGGSTVSYTNGSTVTIGGIIFTIHIGTSCI